LTSAVKGDLSTLGAGLEPHVNFPAVRYNREGLSLSVEDGRLNADYSTALDKDTQLNFRVNEEQAWKASLQGHDASLRVRGQGRDLGSVFWEASQKSSVENVGDVKVDFNSDKEYNFTVARRLLAQLAGADIEGEARATNGGVTSRLGVRRQLPGGAEVSYSVENPVGVYQLGRSMHRGRLSVPVGGGEAALEAEGDDSVQAYGASYKREALGGKALLSISQKDSALGYNVSFARNLDDVIHVNAGVHIGVDDDGMYSRLTAQRDLGRGIGADYEASARVGLDENRSVNLRHALKLSNKLGYVQLLHGSGEAPRLQVGYEFDA